jgi:DNA gyrase inhibitor GyrI
MINHELKGYQLSRLRVRRLRPIQVAYIQQTGPYAEVDVTLFDELVDWARRRGHYTGSNLLIGIGHDAPGITAPDQLRFDACIQIHADARPEGRIGCQVIPEGHYAGTTYVGPYGPTLENAYVEIFEQMRSLRGYEIVGLPAIEIYRTTQIDPEHELNETDIYFLPCRRTGAIHNGGSVVMAGFELSEWVGQSPERVFDFMTDGGNAPRMNPGVTQMIQLTDGPMKVGTRLRETRVMRGKEAQADLEVTAFERPRLYSVRNEQEGFRTTYTYVLAPENGGTRIRLTAEVQAGGLKKLMEGAVAGILKKEDGDHLARMKAAIG